MSEITPVSDNNWILEENEFSTESNIGFEGLFTIGSGYMHLRGSLEEHLYDAPQNEEYVSKPKHLGHKMRNKPKARWGTYVPGIYGKHPVLNNELINLPFFLSFEPTVDDVDLDMEKSRLTKYSRRLHLKDALLVREFDWYLPSGSKVRLRFERFVSGPRKQLCLQRLSITPEREVNFKLQSTIDADVRSNGYNHFRDVDFSFPNDNSVSCKVITDNSNIVEILSELRFEGTAPRQNRTGLQGTLKANINIGASETVWIEKRTVVKTDRDTDTDERDTLLKESESMTYKQLFEEHQKFWHERWKNTDVIIEGDDSTQKSLRLSLYHLLRSHVPEDNRVAIDAKGYAGEAYWGRFFWDNEMFLIPFYSLTDPERAETLVDFRIRSLEGARKNARKYQYEGARYAWESDSEGNECSPNWQYADHEIHITADIVYAMAYYAAATGDYTYLVREAYDVIQDTATYWTQRIDYGNDDSPHLLGVMGPDEYKPIVNDNFYTNLLVSFALSVAASIGRDNGLDDEICEKYEEIANNLPLLANDDGLFLQFDGFEKLAEPDFDNNWKDRDALFSENVTQEKLFRIKALKQADVLMGMYLFEDEFSDDEIKKAYDYYLPYTTHDSSQSKGIHAIVASWLRRWDDAWNFWQDSLKLDLNGGAADGVHIGNAAANWLVAVFGFGGMGTPLQFDDFYFTPKLPEKVSRMAFPVTRNGVSIFIDITKEKVEVTNNSKEEANVTIFDTKKTIAGQTKESFPIKK